MQPRRCRPLQVPQVAGRTLVTAVLLIVGSVFVLGLSLVLPALISTLPALALHLPLALLFVFNVFL